MTVNEDRSNTDKTSCWSILDLHPRKKIFLFDSSSIVNDEAKTKISYFPLKCTLKKIKQKK